MKRIFLLIFLTILTNCLFSAVLPVSSEIGEVSYAKEGSNEALLLAPFLEEYSTSWIVKYVKEELYQSFSLFYSDTLLALLPLKNPIISTYKDYKVNIKDTISGALITVYTDEKLKITSLGIKVDPQAVQEESQSNQWRL